MSDRDSLQKKTPTKKPDGRVCPFLGFNRDPETAISYPSQANCCFHVKPVCPIIFEHQQQFCLSGEYPRCLVFQRQNIAPLPKDIRNSQPGIIRSRPWVPFVALVVVLIIALVAGFQLGIFKVPDSEGNNLAKNDTPLITPVVPTSTGTKPELLISATKIIPTQVIPTASPTKVIFHFLETPIGLNPPLIIHRLAEGEGVKLLAQLYITTPEAILAVNFNLAPVLWVDSVIVIPVGTSDVSGLPKFGTYEVEQVRISIEELAILMQVDVVLLKKYNALPDGYVLRRGEWVLIPQ